MSFKFFHKTPDEKDKTKILKVKEKLEMKIQEVG
jgi:hypothetical protein